MTPPEATHKLFQAAKSGKVSDAEAALDAGTDPNAALAYSHETPLHWAAINGHTDLARLLIEKGANPNARDNLQQTPLHFAARNGHTDLTRLLIEKGADPNARNTWMQIPLHCALTTGHTGVARLLSPVDDEPGGGVSPPP